MVTSAVEVGSEALVIFGVTGDLAHKMTFRALYSLEVAGRLDGPIIGVAVSDWTADQLVASVRDALDSADQPVDREAFGRLARRLTYVQGDFTEPSTYERLASRLNGVSRVLFYLEVPPSLFATVVASLGRAGLTAGGRVMVEKPFGHDLASAQALNREVHEVLDDGSPRNVVRPRLGLAQLG